MKFVYRMIQGGLVGYLLLPIAKESMTGAIVIAIINSLLITGIVNEEGTGPKHE